MAGEGGGREVKMTPEQEFDTLVKLTCALLASQDYTLGNGEFIRRMVGRGERKCAAVEDAVQILEELEESAEAWISPCDFDEPPTLIPPPFGDLIGQAEIEAAIRKLQDGGGA